MHQRFCPTCGTHLFSASEARPHLIIVRAGTLDDREIAKPALTIWTASAPRWACIAERLPRIEGSAAARRLTRYRRDRRPCRCGRCTPAALPQAPTRLAEHMTIERDDQHGVTGIGVASRKETRSTIPGAETLR